MACKISDTSGDSIAAMGTIGTLEGIESYMVHTRPLQWGSEERVLAEARPHLVRLCARLTGKPEAAEDLAQEALLEAWRHREALRDPAVWDAWLSGIARNVCRRWQRRKGRRPSIAGGREVQVPGDTRDGADATTPITEASDGEEGIEVGLERAELAELVDRALALLPPSARQVLIECYLRERPQAEIAARLGVTENVVAVRLHRGKLALRRMLETHFPDEALAYGFVVDADSAGWQETRLWCPECGMHHLIGRLPSSMNGERFQLRCPACHAEPGVYLANAAHDDDHIPVVGARGFKRTLLRMMAWADGFYQPALAGEPASATCPHCAARLHVQHRMPADGPESLREQPGASAHCRRCGWETAQGLGGLLLALPEGRRFWREQGRIRMLPWREVERAGERAWVTSFVSLETAGRFEVVSAAATHRILEVEGRVGA